ncbi:DUF3263 domain-containing protein [Microbacterium album]|uniref:DUF3263 domain-containing protein n=1 Tax=Microbacterium album TaxID=2053191 RepID=A0A917IE28_9MICO|nr:DUF3263 domain-containing protein [Microbacterium album]GGH43790.1 hypothetical protein GCM10010921_18010 [Microbacterium album]
MSSSQPASSPPEGSAAGGLSDRDRAILAFEAEWRRHGGAKEEAIRARLGLTPARYYQLLGRLIDAPEAIAADPLLVGRLRRQRDARLAARRGGPERGRAAGGARLAG